MGKVNWTLHDALETYRFALKLPLSSRLFFWIQLCQKVSPPKN